MVCHSENFIIKINVNILILIQKNGFSEFSGFSGFCCAWSDIVIIQIEIFSNFLITIDHRQRLRIYLIFHYELYLILDYL